MANVLVQCLNKKNAAPVMSICIAKGLADNNNNVYCLLSKQIENLNDWLADDRLTVVLVDTGNRKNFISKTIKMVFVTRRIIYKKFRNIFFDISIQPFMHPWGVLINSAIKCKHRIGICHDPEPHTGESLVNRVFSYISYHSINELIVLTKSFVDKTKKLYRKPVYYMKLGLLSKNLNGFQVKYLPEGRINFLFFGRVEKYKGIGVLLNAYLKICNEHTSLTIAGNGDFSDYNDILKKCTNIELINRYIQEEEIEKLFLKPNTILVVPYLDATQSGVIPIAIDYGVPVIASDTGGLKEQLNDGNFGVFVFPGDVDDLAHAMEVFMKDKKKYCEQQQKIIEYKPQLEWKKIINELMEYLHHK